MKFRTVSVPARSVRTSTRVRYRYARHTQGPGCAELSNIINHVTTTLQAPPVGGKAGRVGLGLEGLGLLVLRIVVYAAAGGDEEGCRSTAVIERLMDDSGSR